MHWLNEQWARLLSLSCEALNVQLMKVQPLILMACMSQWLKEQPMNRHDVQTASRKVVEVKLLPLKLLNVNVIRLRSRPA